MAAVTGRVPPVAQLPPPSLVERTKADARGKVCSDVDEAMQVIVASKLLDRRLAEGGWKWKLMDRPSRSPISGDRHRLSRKLVVVRSHRLHGEDTHLGRGARHHRLRTPSMGETAKPHPRCSTIRRLGDQNSRERPPVVQCIPGLGIDDSEAGGLGSAVERARQNAVAYGLERSGRARQEGRTRTLGAPLGGVTRASSNASRDHHETQSATTRRATEPAPRPHLRRRR